MASKPHTLLHLGSGVDRTIDRYGTSIPLTLVEPHPERAAALHADPARLETLTPIHAGVSPEGKRRLFKLFNIPELSGFRKPTGALLHYPGLRVVDEVFVDGVSLQEVLKAHPFSQDGGNVLVLDVAGDEGDLLTDLITTGTLERFDILEICCAQEPWYLGAMSAEEIRDLLTARDFLVTGTQEDSCGRLWLNVRRDWRRLKDARIRTLEELTESLTSELAMARQDHETALASRTAALEEAKLRVRKRDKEIEALQADLDKARAERNTAQAANKSSQQQMTERNNAQVAEIGRLRLKLDETEQMLAQSLRRQDFVDIELHKLESQMKMFLRIVQPASATLVRKL